jgi:hypothetical protein
MGCSGLTGQLVLPPGLITIGNNAFANCENLNGSLIIPDTVESIGTGAFTACPSFQSLSFSNTTSLTFIPANAFSGCIGLSGELIIPTSVTSIGDEAFAGCGFSGTLTIPDVALSMPGNILTIGNMAFQGCANFTGQLNLPASVYSVGDYAFSGCNGITDVQHYDTTSIGTDAFPTGATVTVIPSNPPPPPPPAGFFTIIADFCNNMMSEPVVAGTQYTITNESIQTQFYISGNPVTIATGVSTVTFTDSGNLSCM